MKNMSYDRIWIFKGLGNWLERSAASKRGMEEDFNKEAERLYLQGHSVVLTAGKNCSFDELFLFERCEDANHFYRFGFQDWELFLDQEEEGCGFQQVAHYRRGALIQNKVVAPTKCMEVDRE